MNHLTTILAVIGLLLSIYNTYIIHVRYRAQLEREGAEKRAHLFDRYLQLFITDPRLFSLYDAHPIKASIPTPDVLLDGKKEGAVYVLLNMYEEIYRTYLSFHSFYQEELWKNVLRRQFRDSQFICLHVEKELQAAIYPANFEQYIRELLKEAGRKKVEEDGLPNYVFGNGSGYLNL